MKTSPRSHRACRAQSGSALVLALLVVIVAVAFTASTMQVTSAVTRRQAQQTDGLRAFYLAEAGLSESFEALRVGRRGQIGSITSPARFGDGLLWVDAMPTDDGRMRLESTAVCGQGRSTLALVVEPVEVPLGIFSDEDLVLDTVLLIDGGRPSSASPPPAALETITVASKDFDQGKYLYMPELELLEYGASFYLVEEANPPSFGYRQSVSVLELNCQDAPENGFKLSRCEVAEKDIEQHAMVVEHALEALGYYADAPLALGDAQLAIDGKSTQLGLDRFSTTDAGGLSFDLGLFWGGREGSTTSTWTTTDWNTSTTSTSMAGAPTPSADLDASGRGLIGSNGGIQVGGFGEAVEIHGDVIPGVDQETVVATDSLVTGDTRSRAETVELQPVAVPAVALLPEVVQDDLLPMVISPGTSGYEAIRVAADSELIVRGPATVVIGTLELAPGPSSCSTPSTATSRSSSPAPSTWPTGRSSRPPRTAPRA